MSNLISNQDLVAELELCIPKSNEINLISAFFTKPAYDWFSTLISNNSPKVKIVGRYSPKDFIDGASSIDAVREAVMAGHVVKILPNLHAKIYQIDNDYIYTGSANMTGKGLALVDNSNLEACARVAPSLKNKDFIQKIIASSIQINLDMIEKMEKYVSSLSTDFAELWPEDIVPRVSELFVSDFPFNKPGGIHEIYHINTSLDFAIIEANNEDFKIAQKYFKESKSYCWLKELLFDNETGRDLGFGKISSLIHDALADDPAPYRKDIKSIQAFLYEYIALYASDEIEIYVPGRMSEVLRLVY